MPAQNGSRSPSPQNLITRRKFVYYSALAGGAVLVPWSASAARARFKSPNEKLNIAVIGAGGKGSSDTDHCATDNIVALCDVDENTLKSRSQKYPKARLFRDYRKSEEIYPLDASTPVKRG